MAGGPGLPTGAPRRAVGVGDPAPGFCLASTTAELVCLDDHVGAPVVLAFYPADHSPVCTQQLRSYNEDLNAFAALGATVLCLSPQDMESHRRFARDHGLRIPLLSDVDKQVGAKYGVLGPLGFYRRSVFVVGSDGTVRFVRRSLSSLRYIPATRLLTAVRDARTPGPSTG